MRRRNGRDLQIDGPGRTWARLDGHLPVATWDVAVSPQRPRTVIATSFYDGRVASQAGINVSNDGGTMLTRPATSTPPAGFCAPARRDEPSAFGISIDRRNPDRVYVGTNCGLAISNDAGATWTFVDPTPNDPATNVWDVVAHNGQIVDICGDDGHFLLDQRRGNVDAWQWTAVRHLLDRGLSPRARRGVCGPRCRRLGNRQRRRQLDLARHAHLRRQGRIPFVETNSRTVPELRSRRSISGVRRCPAVSRRLSEQPARRGARLPYGTTGAVLPPTPPTGWDGPFTKRRWS